MIYLLLLLIFVFIITVFSALKFLKNKSEKKMNIIGIMLKIEETLSKIGKEYIESFEDCDSFYDYLYIIAGTEIFEEKLEVLYEKINNLDCVSKKYSEIKIIKNFYEDTFLCFDKDKNILNFKNLSKYSINEIDTKIQEHMKIIKKNSI